MKTNKSYWPKLGRKILTCLSGVVLSVTSVKAQSPAIILNGNISNNGQCMGFAGGGAPFALTLQGCTATGSWYVDQALALASEGGTGYYLTTPTTTTTANYYGPLKVSVNTTSGLLSRTFTIYPMDTRVTGSVSGPTTFYETGTFTMGGNSWVNSAPYYSWAIGYGAEGVDIIAGQSTSQVTIRPKSWASIATNVVVWGYFQPNGSPCGGASGSNPYDYIAAQRAPYVSYDNTRGAILCSGHQLHVNVWDTSASHYPAAPANTIYKHYTYQWKSSGTTISGATAKDYTPSAAGNYTCDVSQYDWSGSAWVFTMTKTSNAVSIATETTHTAQLFYGSSNLALTNPTAYACNSVTITTNASGNEKSYSISIYKNIGLSALIYSGPTISGPPPASFNLLDYIPASGITASLDGWYTVSIKMNNGCDDYTASGDITIVTPASLPADFTINGNASSTVTAYNCNPINFQQITSSGATDYQLEILSSTGSSIYNSGKITATPPSGAIDLRNICSSVNSNTGCNYLASHTGTYTIRYTAYNKCQVNTRSVTVVIPAPTTASAAFTINGSAANSTTALDVYNCVPIQLNMGSVTGIVNYTLDVLKSGGTIYSSGTMPGAPPASFDLRNLCSSINSNTNCDYLTTGTGTYQVRLTVNNGCVNDVVSGLINVIAPTTSISLQTNTTKLSPYTAKNYIPSSNNVIAPDTVGRYSTSFVLNGSYTTATICSYEYSLEKYDNTSTSWTTVGSVTSSATSCTSSVVQTIPMSVLGTAPGYLLNPANAINGSLWRLKVNLQNNCGPNYQYAVFVIDDTRYLKTSNNNNAGISSECRVQFSPIPFKNTVSATITLSETAKVSMKVYAIDGRMVNEMKETEMQAGQNFQSIQADTWASGIYFYQCTIGKEVFTGKIVKE